MHVDRFEFNLVSFSLDIPRVLWNGENILIVCWLITVLFTFKLYNYGKICKSGKSDNVDTHKKIVPFWLEKHVFGDSREVCQLLRIPL